MSPAEIVAALTYTPVNRAGDTMTGALNFAPLVSVPSAGTTLIGAAASNNLTVSGNTTITAFDSASSGTTRRLRFGAVLTLTHNATSLILPGAANIATAAGDVAQFTSTGGGNWTCDYYQRANGQALIIGSGTPFNTTQEFDGQASQVAAIFTNLVENVNVVAAAPATTQTFYLSQGAVQLYTVNATANWTLNVAGSAGNSLDSVIGVGKSATITMLATQGITPFFLNVFKIDNVTITPKWQGGTAPTAGNASGIDAYTFSIIKTAAATWTVIGAQTQFK